MTDSNKIVFFGTPGFAVASLDALLQAGMNVAAVVTAPDKPSGRGLQLTTTAVKDYAVAHGIPVLQPVKLKDPAFVEALQQIGAALHVVVAFRMLPEIVWNMPPMGTINVHGSLLPQYRGAAPINWAIINGEAETGVTTFKLKHEIDTGDILLSDSTPILPDDNAGSVHDRLMLMGGALLVKTVKGLFDGTIKEQPQPADSGTLKHAPKLFKENMRIDWNQGSEAVRNFVRGLAPYPAAHCEFQGKTMKVFTVSQADYHETPAPGKFVVDNVRMLAGTADGWLSIDELQLEGKKRMDAGSFLRGYKPA
ncbi:MAG: methionyl-tRNA formyltransferase [Chitinophagaceae bacterium]